MDQQQANKTKCFWLSCRWFACWCKWNPMWMNGNEYNWLFMYCCFAIFPFDFAQNFDYIENSWSNFFSTVFVHAARNKTYLLWLDQVILFATSPVQVKQKHSKLKSIGWYVFIVRVWLDGCMLVILNTGTFVYLWTLLYATTALYCSRHGCYFIIIVVAAVVVRDSLVLCLTSP